MGKSLIDYAIESSLEPKDPRNLTEFIKTFRKYHKYLNNKFEAKSRKDLFEYFIELSIDRNQNQLGVRQFFNAIILPLLEEFHGKNLPIVKLIELSRKANVDNVNELKFQFDKLLSLMIAYSNPESVAQSVRDFINESKHPVFQLIWHILNGEESVFLTNFNGSIESMESYCVEQYQSPSKVPYYIATFQMVMFSGAIVHDRLQIIALLSENHLFDEVDLILPRNLELYRNLDYTSSQVLENRRHILCPHNHLPNNMITSNAFKEFLNSRISKSEDGSRIKIDTSFLMSENVDKSKMCYNTESLEYIEQNEELQKNLSHPTILTYIDLKYYMYQNIFFWNFWCFFILIVVYFWNAYDIIRNSSKYFHVNHQIKKDFDPSVAIVIILMLCRELFQVWIVGGFQKHLQRFSNKIELFLILSLFFAMCLDVHDHHRHKHQDEGLFVNLTCFNILVMTMLLMTMIPYNFMYRYMLLFKKVLRTFVKFLFTFMSVLSAFIFVFMIIFHSDNVKYDISELKKNNNLNYSYNGFSNVSNAINFDSSDDDNFPRFFRVDKIGVAFVKVILMLSGDYEANLLEREPFQLVYIATFVVVTFVCFNLIIGLTTNDVQAMEKDVLQTSARQRALKLIQINQNYSKFCLKMDR